MTPKEKAIHIRNSFIDVTKNYHPEEGWVKDLHSATVAAKICVDEVIYNEYQLMCSLKLHDPENIYYSKYWGDVRNELELL